MEMLYPAAVIIPLAIVIYLFESRADAHLFEKQMKIASVPMLLVIGLFVLVLWSLLRFIPGGMTELQYLVIGTVILWGLVSLSIVNLIDSGR